MYIYTYMYIYRERERENNLYIYIERERDIDVWERFFIPIRDVENNRGGARNCYQTPPCKQRGGGKAGTGVVKYEN